MKMSLYVPAVAGLGIDAKSGIVGRPYMHRAFERGAGVELFYEGNRYGYANVKTYADRVRVAAGRMAESYPTVARKVVGPAEVIEVGVVEYAAGRIDALVVYPACERTLAEWLEFAPEEYGDLAESGELLVSE